MDPFKTVGKQIVAFLFEAATVFRIVIVFCIMFA